MNVAIVPEAKKIVSQVKKKTTKLRNVEIVFCPPFIYLQALAGMVKGKWKLGAQNVFGEESGSYTGEVSGVQLRQFGVSYIILGHSERRNMGETDEMVNKKIISVLRARMVPVVCIGESVRNDHGEHLEFIKNQISKTFAGISKGSISDVVIAYEPIWAIGAKEAMVPRDIHEMTIYIKKCLREMFGLYASGVQVLYGGAVNPRNTSEIIRDGFVDGLLVGRDSIEAENFIEIIKEVDKVK